MSTPPIVLAALLEPALPDLSTALISETVEVEAAIRRLEGRIAGGLEHVIRPVSRAAHTHHSLYIEDRPSTLVELARAEAPVAGRRKRDPEADLRASLELLTWLHEGDGRTRASSAPTDLGLLREFHTRFYAHLPEEARRLVVSDTGREVDVVPGEWRSERVSVGTHDAPEAADLDPLLARWESRFAPRGFPPGAERLLALIASHHRLLFIHPFRDGNGRVARFALDAGLIAIGLDAKGAWTPARGFARARRRYYDTLAAADAERRNATDGRGGRSAEGLLLWSRFVLGVFREQVEFVSALLEPTLLRERLDRAVGASLDTTSTAAEHAGRLVSAAWTHGPITRADIVRMSGVPTRTAHRLLSRLAELGWVRKAVGDDKRTSPLIGALPLTAAPSVFPKLFLSDAEG